MKKAAKKATNKKLGSRIVDKGGTSSPYPRQAQVPMGPGADVPGKMPHPVQLPKLRNPGKGKR